MSTNPNATPVINLAKLVREAGRIQLEDGTEHVVRPISGAVFHALKQVEEQEQSASELFTAVGIVVPTMTEAQVLALTPEQAHAVLQLSAGDVVAVEQLRSKPAGLGKRRKAPGQ